MHPPEDRTRRKPLMHTYHASSSESGGGNTPPYFDPRSILQEFCVVITNQRSLGREKNYSMRYGRLKIGPRIGR